MATPNMNLPQMPQNTFQPSTDFNVAMQELDVAVPAVVQSVTLAAPPATTDSDIGKAWIIAASPTGVWAGRANQIAFCTATNLWKYIVPRVGWRWYSIAQTADYRYDGNAWNVVVGGGGTPIPPTADNMLINCGVPINQDNFAGGALAAGAYGYDMWKAGSGGCNVTINSSTGLFTHTSGTLVQVIELPQLAWGRPLTFSVEDPSGTVTVTVGDVSGTITSGAGRRGVTLTPNGSGNLTVQVSATNVTYLRPKLERGTAATIFTPRHVADEIDLCQRYYLVIRNAAGMPFANASVRFANQVIATLGFKPMRQTPAASHTGTLTAAIAGAPTNASAVTATSSSAGYLYLALTVSGLTPGQAGYIYAAAGNDSVIRLDARL